jgi:hypothetical protein
VTLVLIKSKYNLPFLLLYKGKLIINLMIHKSSFMFYFAFFLFSIIGYTTADTIPDVILTPETTFKKNSALLLAPGFGIGADAYEPLGKMLQDNFANNGLGLYFGVPHMNGNITTVGLKKALTRVSTELVESGLPQEHSTFFAGHSVGGALLPYILKDLSNLPDGFNKPDGMILLASFLVRAFRSESIPDIGPGQYSFPNCPVLSIGAELDGLARISRFAEAYYNQIVQNTDPSTAKKQLPITMIEGMTHMQFASGPIPKEVMNRDLLPEISYEDAHSMVATDMSYFASAILNLHDWNYLNDRIKSSEKLLSPMIEAMKVEGYHQLKPPCYCNASDEYGGLEYGTCPEQPGCTAGSLWTEYAQQIMANPDYHTGKGIVMDTQDSQHVVTDEKPSCHLPHLHSGTDRDTGYTINNIVASDNPGNGSPSLCITPDTCTIKANTVTQLMYEEGSEMDIWRIDIGNDNVDTGYYPITASEMKCKLKSRQSIFQAANVTAAVNEESGSTFNDLDGNQLGNCAAINNESIEYAINNAPLGSINRYNNYGQKMVISTDGDKKVCTAGPCWIWASLEYNGKNKKGDVTIKSPAFPYKNSNPYPCDEKLYPKDDRKEVLPCTAGMHYCKLLSPARVMEWIMVDSLRLNYSLKSKK